MENMITWLDIKFINMEYVVVAASPEGPKGSSDEVNGISKKTREMNEA